MPFITESVGGSLNSTSNVSLVTGPATGRREVKTVVIHNRDSAERVVIISAVLSSVEYHMFQATLAPGASFIQDVPVVLSVPGNLIRAKLSASAAVQPHFVVTYSEVTP
jgi:hypothetical protein